MSKKQAEFLPPGYEYDPSRKVDAAYFVFANADVTPGYKGLAYAVLLMAVADGCSAKWLKDIAEFYHIEAPAKLLDKKPIPLVAIADRTGDFYNPVDQPHRRKARRNMLSPWLFAWEPKKARKRTSDLLRLTSPS